MYFQFDNNPITTMETMRSFGAYGNYLFFRKIFQIENLDNNEEKIKNYFIKYNENVENFFENNIYNYLQIDITNDESTIDKIAGFLNNQNALSIGFPHLNKGNYQNLTKD